MSARGRSGAHALWEGLRAEYLRYQESVGYIPTAKIRLQEDLRRYLCLRCAGFLEQVTHVVLSEYLDQKSSGPVREFAGSHFKYAPNLRVSPYLDLIGRFGPTYRAAFEEFLDKSRRDTLTDLLEVRNDIAHGRYSTGRKLDPAPYMTICEEVYDWLVETFLGASAEVLAEDGRTVINYANTT